MVARLHPEKSPCATASARHRAEAPAPGSASRSPHRPTTATTTSPANNAAASAILGTAGVVAGDEGRILSRRRSEEDRCIGLNERAGVASSCSQWLWLRFQPPS